MILGGVLFIFGLIVGSAINSFLWRYQTKTTYKGRSMCPVCKHQLAWYDNIPLISWLLLSAKCRYCKKSISVQYPIVELITGLAFGLVGTYSAAGIYISHVTGAMIELGTFFKAGQLIVGILELLLALAVSTILIMISVYDYKTKEIPNGFNLGFILTSAAYLLISHLQLSDFQPRSYITEISLYLLAAVIAFLFFYSFVFFSKETWMGGGDAKMAFGMGLLLGPAGTFLAILIASVTGSIYGLSVLALTKKSKQPANKPSRHEVPFGPFLALGSYISLIFGSQMIAWYVKIVLGI